MASEKDRSNNEEVSDRRLTNMALDIARGLSYLADKKYVHRDLACRNCLVNTSRSVKIGDFGMCRKMFDSDYYRYSKKGKVFHLITLISDRVSFNCNFSVYASW